MKKQIQLFLMSFLIISGIMHQPQAEALTVEIDVEGIALGAGLVAGGFAAYYGIQWLIDSLWWTDDAILIWAEQNTKQCKNKYAQITRFTRPDIAHLQLFGNRNRAWKAFPSKAEEIFINNPSFAPLHNAKLIITQDRETLLDIQYHLIKRELTNDPCCNNFYADLLQLLDLLDNLTCAILASPEYTNEAHKLDNKLDRLYQQQIDQERNDVLKDQVYSLRNKPNVIIIN